MNNWDHINCMTIALSMEKELTNVLQKLHASAFNIGDTEVSSQLVLIISGIPS